MILPFLLASVAVEQAHSFSRLIIHHNHRVIRLYSEIPSRSPDFVPGQGEWPEWDQPASLDEELYTYEEDSDDVANLSSGFMKEIGTINAGRGLVGDFASKIPENINKSETEKSVPSNSSDPLDPPRRSATESSDWKGWSEEPPYFDEDDVQDDESNWGRKDESAEDSFSSASSGSPFSSSSSSQSSSYKSEWDRFTDFGVQLESTSAAAQVAAATISITAQDSQIIASLTARIYNLEKKLVTIQQSQSVPQQRGSSGSISLTLQLAFLAAFLTFQIILVSKL